MKHSTTIIRSIACVLVSALIIGLLGCEKKRRRSRRSSSSGDTTEQTSKDSTADKTSFGIDRKDPDKVTAPDITDHRTPPATSGITVAVQCTTAGTLSLLDGTDKVLATTTANSPIVKCELPGHINSAITLRFEPADGSPGTQRLLLLPIGESLIIRRLISSTQGNGWVIEPVEEKAVEKSPKKVTQSNPTPTATPEPKQPTTTKPPPPKTTAKQPLDDWVASQSWFKKLASEMPKGVTLTISVTPSKDPGWSNIHIRERHAPDSGFDPNVSPLIGTFRVSPDRNTLKWLDPLTGDWASVADFVKSRTPSPADPPTPQPPRKLAANELAADIDQDGRLEIIRWTLIPPSGDSRYFQLKVLDDNGKTIWSGPNKKVTDHPFVFFESDFGISMPELLHDIDQDGHIELLAPEPQSDVSPTSYRRITWKNGTFNNMDSLSLMLNSPTSPSFQWKKTTPSYGIWVSKLGPVTAQGLVTAEVTYLSRDSQFDSGTALLRFNSREARIEKWIKRLKKLPIKP